MFLSVMGLQGIPNRTRGVVNDAAFVFGGTEVRLPLFEPFQTNVLGSWEIIRFCIIYLYLFISGSIGHEGQQ